MNEPMRLLVAGRSAPAVEVLCAMIRGAGGWEVTRQVIGDGHTDPLHGVESMPDVLLLRTSEQWCDELQALSSRPAASRPIALIVGPAGDASAMRMAMQAGARDFLTEPLVASDLHAALQRIAEERVASGTASTGRLTAFINAKGGSGATLLACNTAHMMAAAGAQKVALIDLDIQFGTLPHYLDLNPKHGLLEALENVEHLDAVALDGYMLKHSSGLRVLGSTSDSVVLAHELAAEKLAAMLTLLRDSYQQVVVDLPRQIDHLTSNVLEMADQVVIVLQQSLTHIRDATRLIGILRDELDLDDDRIRIIVNRYQKSTPISLADVGKALRHDLVVAVPNDFRNVSESTNSGIPLYATARSAAITRSLLRLKTELSGDHLAGRPGLLARAVAMLGG